MSKKLPDDTIYMKVNGKFTPVGKIYDRGNIGYGNYFCYSEKYSTGIRAIEASPNPDFIGLETAVEMSRDELREAMYETFYKYYKDTDKNKFFCNWYMVGDVIQAIRKTFIKKQKELLHAIKNV